MSNPFGPGTPEYEAWERQVRAEGAALLDEVHAALTRYVVFPTPEAADAVSLYVAATHAQPAWEHATRLVIKSPLKQCGKTRLQEIIAELAHNPLRTTNISPAALVRAIDADDPPTIMLDEADTIFTAKRGERSESAEDIRGIINAGHSRGAPYIRWDQAKRTLEECPTFAMAVIGGIGDMPDTIEDRAVIVSMRRRAPGETVKPYRIRRDRPPLQELRNRLHRWVRERLDELAVAEPDLPVEDRPADVWESLVAIADAAGGDWPARARKACVAMTGARDADDGTIGERLLADLYAIWGKADYLFTTTIIDRLCEIDEAPWGDWYGRKLTSRDLARLLKPYGVRSKTVREPGSATTAKGYARADLLDPWTRYVTTVTTTQRDETAGQDSDGCVTEDDCASVTSHDQRKQTGCDGVTDVTGDPQGVRSGGSDGSDGCRRWLGAEGRYCGVTEGLRRFQVGWLCPEHQPQTDGGGRLPW